MSAAHLHLVLNHAPLFGVVFAALGLALGLARSNEGIARASLGLLVLAGALVLPVYLTGEDADDLVEGQPGVSERMIEVHEKAALGAALALCAVGVLALLVLVGFRKRALPSAVTALVLVLALGVGGWIGYVANLGGQISHPEIRAGTGGSAPSESRGADERRSYEDDD